LQLQNARRPDSIVDCSGGLPQQLPATVRPMPIRFQETVELSAISPKLLHDGLLDEAIPSASHEQKMWSSLQGAA